MGKLTSLNITSQLENFVRNEEEQKKIIDVLTEKNKLLESEKAQLMAQNFALNIENTQLKKGGSKNIDIVESKYSIVDELKLLNTQLLERYKLVLAEKDTLAENFNKFKQSCVESYIFDKLKEELEEAKEESKKYRTEFSNLFKFSEDIIQEKNKLINTISSLTDKTFSGINCLEKSHSTPIIAKTPIITQRRVITQSTSQTIKTVPKIISGQQNIIKIQRVPYQINGHRK